MIHWKYIKGLNSQNNSDCYTYINFAETETQPTIKVNDINCGQILTCEGPGQWIIKPLQMYAPLSFKSENDKIELVNEDFTFTGDKKINLNIGSFTKVAVTGTKIDIKDCEVQNGSVKLTGSNIETPAVSSTSINNTDTITTKNITVNNECAALYFNATSDRRAKTDIKPIEISATDIITSTPVYSFTYKDEKVPSIGVIAQDLQDVKIGDFDLVENKAASGVDYDYMSIHESKLIYVLWKAVQEQQAEIEKLKEELKKRG